MTETSELRAVLCGGARIAYLLERKPVRNLNLRIRRDGAVCASAPPFVPAARVDAFVAGRGERILAALRRIEERERARSAPRRYVSGELFPVLGETLRLEVSSGAPEAAEAREGVLHLRLRRTDDAARRRSLVEKYLDGRCREEFERILARAYPPFRAYGVAMPALRIRHMTSRWGSCLTAKGVVTLNRRLLAAPRACAEYVAVHELCHLVHPDHSGAFYDLLTRQMPDWPQRRALLRACADSI